VLIELRLYKIALLKWRPGFSTGSSRARASKETPIPLTQLSVDEGPRDSDGAMTTASRSPATALWGARSRDPGPSCQPNKSRMIGTSLEAQLGNRHEFCSVPWCRNGALSKKAAEE
jgi:hypothetical protein